MQSFWDYDGAGEQASEVLERCEGWTQELLPLLLLSQVECCPQMCSSSAHQGVERKNRREQKLKKFRLSLLLVFALQGESSQLDNMEK